jgi:hypothetical protein
LNDQWDDDLVSDQWLAAPVHGDEGEQAMLDFIPLAGPGRQMGHCDFQAGLIGKPLQLALP